MTKTSHILDLGRHRQPRRARQGDASVTLPSQIAGDWDRTAAKYLTPPALGRYYGALAWEFAALPLGGVARRNYNRAARLAFTKLYRNPENRK
jgi:hypothetical protein